jgi:hypothetical protein
MKFPTTAFFAAATLIPGGVFAALLPKDVVVNIRVDTTISGNIASTQYTYWSHHVHRSR